MEINLPLETEAMLREQAVLRGCDPADIMQDAFVEYMEKVSAISNTLDSRYDDMISGKVKMLSSEEGRLAFENYRSDWLAKRG